MGFLKVILIIIIIFYALGFLFRFALARFMKKMQNKANQFQNQEPSNNRKEGEVIIDYIPKTEKKKNKKGEYTDYEEIK